MSDDIQNNEDFDPELTQGEVQEDGVTRITKVSGMYEDYFLDYASYVILERAVPDMISINIGIIIVNDKIVRSTPRIEKTGAIFISAISLSQFSYSQNIST